MFDVQLASTADESQFERVGIEAMPSRFPA
jgi:hypothetical protein